MADIAISDRFPRYKTYDPLVPVWCVTPQTPRTIHRYFDSSPFSPSGRYLVSTQLPYEDRMPVPGDAARVIVSDLATGDERCVAETKGWDTQLGAHAHWGNSDAKLLFNDLDVATWTPYGVQLDLENGRLATFEGPIYAVSHDRRFAVTPCLKRTVLALPGYGVVVPPAQIPSTGAGSESDGIFITDLTTGNHRLLISFRRIVDSMDVFYGQRGNEAGEFVGFHVVISPDDRWILAIVRWIRLPSQYQRLALAMRREMSRFGRKVGHWTGQEAIRKYFAAPKMFFRTLLLVRTDGSESRVILPADEFEQGGHHPSWSTDGRTIVMNRMSDGRMRFVRFDLEENRWHVLSDRVFGSGHPTLFPEQRHILTDAYYSERVAAGDGTVPIRLIDWPAGTELNLVRMATRPPFLGPKMALRIDPHPALNPSFTRVAFNGFADGTRRVYVADLSNLDLAMQQSS